jgi:hypothetical protein
VRTYPCAEAGENDRENETKSESENESGSEMTHFCHRCCCDYGYGCCHSCYHLQSDGDGGYRDGEGDDDAWSESVGGYEKKMGSENESDDDGVMTHCQLHDCC